MIKIRPEDQIIPFVLSKTISHIAGTPTYHLRLWSIIISFRFKDATGKSRLEVERVK